MRKTIISSVGLLLIFATSFAIVNQVGTINTSTEFSNSVDPNATGFGITSGNEMYYISMSSFKDQLPEIMYVKVLSSGENFISYDVLKANNQTNWNFQSNGVVTEIFGLEFVVDVSFSMDLMHHIIPSNISTFYGSMYNYNQTFGLDSIIRAKFQMSVVGFSSSYSTGNSIHRISVAGNNITNGQPYNYTSIWDGDSGALLYQYYGNNSGNWTTLAMDFPTEINPTTFGYVQGDIIKYISGDNLAKKESKEEESKNDERIFKYQVEKVAHIFKNFETNEDLIVINQTTFNDTECTVKIWWQPWIIQGVVIAGDPSTSMQSKYGEKDLFNYPNMELTIRNTLTKFGFNLESVTVDLAGKTYKYSGRHPNGLNFTYWGDLLPGFGGSKYFAQYEWNVTTKEVIRDSFELMMDGPGTNHTAPEIGVAVGDSYQIVGQYDRYQQKYNSSWSNPGYNYTDTGFQYMEIKVTHIFALNGTTMGVFGDIFQWTTSYNTRVKTQHFTPLMIYNYKEKASFLNFAGWGSPNGPMLLMPKGISWTAIQSEILNALADMAQTPMTGYKLTNSWIRVSWQQNNQSSGTTSGSSSGNSGNLYYEANAQGIPTSFIIEQNRWYSSWNNSYNYHEQYQENQMFFLQSMNLAAGTSCNGANASAVTNANSNSIMVWAKSSYRPMDSNNNPAMKYYTKLQLASLISACDGHIVAIGSIYNKQTNQSTFSPKTFMANGVPTNMWIISSVRANDIWSWFGGKPGILDKSVADLSPYKSDIAEMLSVGFSTNIPESAINVSGRQFTAEISEGDMKHGLKFAVNSEGLLQDMISYDKYSNGTYRSWERIILANSTLGESGEVFENPDYYVPESGIDADSELNPFVPGYPLEIFAICSFIGLIYLMKKRTPKIQ